MKNPINSLYNTPLTEMPYKTIFEIGKIDSTENIISDFYAFFLKPNESHNLGSIFLESLIELLCRKGAKLSNDWDNCIVKREVWIKRKGIVDFLIEKGEKNNRKVIMIESKIKAAITNDLDLYWESLLKIPIENKTAVLLTMQHIESSHPQFINITHEEWMGIVYKKLQSIKKMTFYKLLALQLCSLFYNTKEYKTIIVERSNYFVKNKEKINRILNPDFVSANVTNKTDAIKIEQLSSLSSSYYKEYFKALEKNIYDLPIKIATYKLKATEFDIIFQIKSIDFKITAEFYDETFSNSLAIFLSCNLEKAMNSKYWNMFKKLIQKPFNNWVINKGFLIPSKDNRKDEKIKKYLIAWKTYKDSELINANIDTFLKNLINKDFIPLIRKIETILK